MGTTWLRALAAVAGLGLMISAGVAQGPKDDGGDEPGFKQMRLTEKQVQGFISAQKQLAPLQSKLEALGDKSDPGLQKQVEQIARSNGFASLEEFGDVSSNISVVLDGLDPGTGEFTEPPDQIRKEMDMVKQDKRMSAKERSDALAEMQEALKTATPLQFKDNVAIVKKYQKQLDQVLGGSDKQK